jgi:hypothetical protein
MKSKSAYAHLILAFLLPLLLLLLLGMSSWDLSYGENTLVKWKLPDALNFGPKNAESEGKQDTLLKMLRARPLVVDSVGSDTTRHRVMLIGDSQCDGLLYPLNNYCNANGHKLVSTVIWYSATVYNFSKSDTIRKLIAQSKPTFIVLVLGLNEIYAKDLKNRQLQAVNLVRSFGNTPYAWVGPAFWETDMGIDTAYSNVLEDQSYHTSKHLQLTRAEDKRHPDKAGYEAWFSRIRYWLTNHSRYRLNLAQRPKSNKPDRYTGRLTVLHALKYKGY